MIADVLTYLQQDLHQYRGGDIIDVNPGACVWSQHIHEALSPRCHLLMEPEEKYFEQFVKPLLKKSNSTYRHTNLQPTHPQRYWNTYEKVFRDELLPRREALQQGDPALRRPNHSLLVTGNLHRLYKAIGKPVDYINKCRTLLNHMVHSAQVNTLFHSYGLVRMLFWVPDELSASVMPATVEMHNGRQVAMEMAADIAQVVTLPKQDTEKLDRRTLKGRPRPFLFDEIAVLRTSQRMAQRQMEMPKQREPVERPKIIENRESIEKKSRELDTPGRYNSAASVEVLMKDISSLEGDIATFVEVGKKKLKHQKDEHVRTEHKHLFEEGFYEPAEIPMKNRFADFMGLSARQVIAEAHYYQIKGTLTHSLQGDLEQQLLLTTANIRRGMHNIGTAEFENWANRFTHLFNEQLALFQDPPILPIDRRPYEPLVANEDEFWPNIPCMLLDINPLGRTFQSDITSAMEGNAVMRDLIRGISQYRVTPLIDALNHIAPDAGKDLYEAVPELKDPNKGGRLDPQDLKVYQLNRYLLEKLVVAYLEWPFRPSDAELAAFAGKDSRYEFVAESETADENDPESGHQS